MHACCSGLRFDSEYSETCRLADATLVRLRLLRETDRAKLLASFERPSAESRYARFFTAMPRLREQTLERLLRTDGWNRLAISAEDGDGPEDRAEGYGIARFVRLAEAPNVSEAAIVVFDHMQRRGPGKLLLARLAAAARERGISRFRAEVLRTNQPMIALVHEFDATAQPALDGPVATYELAIPEEDEPETLYGTLFRSLRRATGSASRGAAGAATQARARHTHSSALVNRNSVEVIVAP